jgi:oligo-1,6-glucosidase
VNPNYKQINAAQETADSNSIYHYFQQMLKLRKSTKAFAYGTYEDLDPQNEKIFAYTRTLGKEHYLVVLNFSHDAVSYTIPKNVRAGKILLSNSASTEQNTNKLALKGWEARVYELGS